MRDSFRIAWYRKGSILLAAVTRILAIAVGFVACIIPGVYLILIWFIVYPALMFEGVSAMDALGRSFRLMEGHMLKALVIGIGTACVTIPLQLGVSSLSAPYVSALLCGTVGAAEFVFGVVLTPVVYFSARCCIEPITMEMFGQLSGKYNEEILPVLEDA